MDPSSNQTVVLDTHAWIWLMEGDRRLSESGVIERAELAASAGSLHVSSISLWEVAMLESLERVRLTVPVATWLSEALQTPGLTVVRVDEALAAESAHLPGDFTGDGCDRLIVATTRLNDGVLITADPAIIRYGSEGHVRVLEIA